MNADPSDDHWDTMVMGINSGLRGQGFQTSRNVRPKRKISRSYPFLFNVPPAMFDSNPKPTDACGSKQGGSPAEGTVITGPVFKEMM